MPEQIEPERSGDGVDRRGFLKCMAWAGAGAAWALKGGVLQSLAFAAESAAPAGLDFSFVQFSDSHIGFHKGVYTDVVGTFEMSVMRANALPQIPSFALHTGDLTHMSKPKEFDTVAQVMKSLRADRSFYVPGEHDYFLDDGRQYREQFGRGTLGTGWHSFDYKGCHFIGLVNVTGQGTGNAALGVLGREQVEWLAKDVSGLGDSTPIVIFAHAPLWTVYPDWGWGTEDSAEAMRLVRRFGSVAVLNGHIHQVMQKVEGNITFHTARSTAFPQPEPGKALSPGPRKDVPAEQLRRMLGITSVNYIARRGTLATIDSTLQ